VTVSAIIVLKPFRIFKNREIHVPLIRAAVRVLVLTKDLLTRFGRTCHLDLSSIHRFFDPCPTCRLPLSCSTALPSFCLGFWVRLAIYVGRNPALALASNSEWSTFGFRSGLRQQKERERPTRLTDRSFVPKLGWAMGILSEGWKLENSANLCHQNVPSIVHCVKYFPDYQKLQFHMILSNQWVTWLFCEMRQSNAILRCETMHKFSFYRFRPFESETVFNGAVSVIAFLGIFAAKIASCCL